MCDKHANGVLCQYERQWKTWRESSELGHPHRHVIIVDLDSANRVRGPSASKAVVTPTQVKIDAASEQYWRGRSFHLQDFSRASVAAHRVHHASWSCPPPVVVNAVEPAPTVPVEVVRDRSQARCAVNGRWHLPQGAHHMSSTALPANDRIYKSSQGAQNNANVPARDDYRA